MTVGLRYVSATLIVLAIGLGYALTRSQERPALRLDPRPAAAARPAPGSGFGPSARDILDRGAALSLSAEQRRGLEAVDREWRRESARLAAALEIAVREFSRFMDDAQAAPGVTIQEIQGRSAAVRSLGADLREGRRRHAHAAAQLLTESQRRRLALATPSGTPGGDR